MRMRTVRVLCTDSTLPKSIRHVLQVALLSSLPAPAISISVSTRPILSNNTGVYMYWQWCHAIHDLFACTEAIRRNPAPHGHCRTNNYDDGRDIISSSRPLMRVQVKHPVPPASTPSFVPIFTCQRWQGPPFAFVSA